MKSQSWIVGRTCIAFIPYKRPWLWRKLIATVEFDDGSNGRGWAFGPLMFFRSELMTPEAELRVVNNLHDGLSGVLARLDAQIIEADQVKWDRDQEAIIDELQEARRHLVRARRMARTAFVVRHAR